VDARALVAFVKIGAILVIQTGNAQVFRTRFAGSPRTVVSVRAGIAVGARNAVVDRHASTLSAVRLALGTEADVVRRGTDYFEIRVGLAGSLVAFERAVAEIPVVECFAISVGFTRTVARSAPALPVLAGVLLGARVAIVTTDIVGRQEFASPIRIARVRGACVAVIAHDLDTAGTITFLAVGLGSAWIVIFAPCARLGKAGDAKTLHRVAKGRPALPLLHGKLLTVVMRGAAHAGMVPLLIRPCHSVRFYPPFTRSGISNIADAMNRGSGFSIIASDSHEQNAGNNDTIADSHLDSSSPSSHIQTDADRLLPGSRQVKLGSNRSGPCRRAPTNPTLFALSAACP